MKRILFVSSAGTGWEALNQALERNRQVAVYVPDPGKLVDLKT